MKINESKVCRFLKKAQDGYEMMDSYCSKIKREIEPFIYPIPEESTEYTDFGVQWMTDGFCCYFDETVVPVKAITSFIAKWGYIDYKNIKKLAI